MIDVHMATHNILRFIGVFPGGQGATFQGRTKNILINKGNKLVTPLL